MSGPSRLPKVFFMTGVPRERDGTEVEPSWFLTGLFSWDTVKHQVLVFHRQGSITGWRLPVSDASAHRSPHTHPA